MFWVAAGARGRCEQHQTWVVVKTPEGSFEPPCRRLKSGSTPRVPAQGGHGCAKLFEPRLRAPHDGPRAEPSGLHNTGELQLWGGPMSPEEHRTSHLDVWPLSP